MEAFDRFQGNRAVRAALGYWLLDRLIEARRYPDALEAVPLDRFRARFDAMKSAPNLDPSLRAFIVESGAQELEVLAGAGKLDDARDLVKAVLAFDSSDSTVAAIRKHLERAGHADLLANVPEVPKRGPAERPLGGWRPLSSIGRVQSCGVRCRARLTPPTSPHWIRCF